MPSNYFQISLSYPIWMEHCRAMGGGFAEHTKVVLLVIDRQVQLGDLLL
jgi:hypothetical protein